MRSHYKNPTPNRETLYRVGNGIAEWLGLYSAADIYYMQEPAQVERLRQLIRDAS